MASGDLAVVLYFQGSAPLGGQVEMVDTYARLGVRVIQLTYVRRMQALGVTVELAYAGERTCLEALSIAQRLMIISHGNAHAVCDSPATTAAT